MIFLSEDGIMFLIYAIPGLFNPSLNIILTHFWDEIILWEAVEIIVEITVKPGAFYYFIQLIDKYFVKGFRDISFFLILAQNRAGLGRKMIFKEF